MPSWLSLCLPLRHLCKYYGHAAIQGPSRSQYGVSPLAGRRGIGNKWRWAVKLSRRREAKSDRQARPAARKCTAVGWGL